MSHKFFLLYFVLSVFISCRGAVLAQGSDTLKTSSGDQLIGEIESMQKSVLVFSTDYADDDFQIEWDKILGISTGREYFVNDRQGNLYDCLIRPASSDSLILQTPTGSIKKAFEEIVEIRTKNERIIDKIDFDIHLGYTFTRSDETHQIVLRSNAGYRAAKWYLGSSFNSFTTISASTSSRRVDADVNAGLSLSRNWYLIGIFDLLTSEVLDLDLRTTTSLAIAHYLIRNNQANLFMFAGVTFNNEVFDRSESSSQRSMEALLGGQAEIFGLDHFSLLSQVYVFPSVTESKRIRINSNLDLNWDLTKRIDLKLGFTLNYDQRPPENAENLDYVFSLTLGWEF